MTRPSLFEFAGGEPAFLALAGAHHDRCLQDPVLNHPFSHGTHPEHVQRLGQYWAEVFGGPPHFSSACGGHSAMIGVHAGEGVDEDLQDRFVRCFVQAADDAGLPGDAEFRAALRAYMQWAVADVFGYPDKSRVPAGLAMPLWTWKGLTERA
jgi:hemoglobin